MKRFGRESGYAAPQFLFVFILVSAIACGACIVVSAIVRSERAARTYTERSEACAKIVGAIVKDLESDTTPDSDTRDDPIWLRDGVETEGYMIAIRSLSGYLNPNFLRKDLIEKTDFRLLLKDGKTADDLQQHRWDKGLGLGYGSYADFFSREDFEKYFSCYGWLNPNLVDDFAFERYAGSLTGSEGRAQTLRAKLQAAWVDKKTITNANMRAFFGLDYDELFPYVNAESVLNVNFTDRFIIYQLVSYPLYKVQSPKSRAEDLIALRESGIEDPSKISMTLGIDSANPLMHWFGCKTWFWEVTLESSGARRSYVICRIPQDTLDSAKKPVYRIIEQGASL